MAEITVTVLNPHGLHARPAALFVQKASTCEGSVEVVAGEKKGDAKSILSIMGMGIEKGASVLLRAEGSNAQEVLKDLRKILEDSEA
ncbi:MAG TPA: HPr family phosphocarrier protein [Synergistaceae bacterium]|nr:HPr family phosphocarrier protein [Synergistaceae bacterium]HPJ24686.1 HPr family phosphocarrier protein [Synergistaceae bacterium]HPQ37515.1 HPr family phosphocarrier protein [Synergistaceae bacterium]